MLAWRCKLRHKRSWPAPPAARDVTVLAAEFARAKMFTEVVLQRAPPVDYLLQHRDETGAFPL